MKLNDYLVISGDITCLPGLLALVADESPPLVQAGSGGGEPNAWIYKISKFAFLELLKLH